MRDAETAAVSTGISLDELMERAGKECAAAIERFANGVWAKRVVVLVGPGNNGGDGLVTARHLARRGASVECFVPLRRKVPDAKRDVAVAAGARVLDTDECGGLPAVADALQRSDLIVDAVFGIGQNRPVQEPLVGIFRAARHAARPVFAIDLPSGCNSDTGALDRNGLPATITLMLGLPKLGPLLQPAESGCGQIEVLDIGLPPDAASPAKTEVLTQHFAKAKLPHRPPSGHKGTFGRLLILAGSKNYVGAAILATASALKGGAGLVELAAPIDVCRASASRILEAIYRPLPQDADGEIDILGSAAELLDAAGTASALLVGPGMGQARATRQLLLNLLPELPASLPLVIDADGLNLFSTVPAWERLVKSPAVLTPHPGEMSRLLRLSASEIQADRLSAAMGAARGFGKVVVLKGAATIISDPDGFSLISPWVNSGLAKGGTGDVLGGLIGSLLAQKPGDPFSAACAGVYIHGLAGHIAKGKFGEYAMTAGDVISCLPDAFSELTSGITDAAQG